MSAFWCESIVRADGTLEACVRVEANRGVITRIAPGPARNADIRLEGIVGPGEVIRHTHSWHRALEQVLGDAIAIGDCEPELTSRRASEAALAALGPADYRRLAAIAFGELVRAGVTLVGEFHTLHRAPFGLAYADPTAMADAVLAGAADAGIRITLFDALALRAGVSPYGSTLPASESQLRFLDPTVRVWAERHRSLRAGPRAKIGAGIVSLLHVPAHNLTDFDAVVSGEPVQVHVNVASDGTLFPARYQRIGVDEPTLSATEAYASLGWTGGAIEIGAACDLVARVDGRVRVTIVGGVRAPASSSLERP